MTSWKKKSSMSRGVWKVLLHAWQLMLRVRSACWSISDSFVLSCSCSWVFRISGSGGSEVRMQDRNSFSCRLGVFWFNVMFSRSAPVIGLIWSE